MATVKGDCERGCDRGGEKQREFDILEHAFEYKSWTCMWE